MPCGLSGIDSGWKEVNDRPYCTATHPPRRTLQIKTADWKENGQRLLPNSFSAFKRPQGRSGFQANVPGIDIVEGVEGLEVNKLQDQQGTPPPRRIHEVFDFTDFAAAPRNVEDARGSNPPQQSRSSPSRLLPGGRSVQAHRSAPNSRPTLCCARKTVAQRDCKL